VIDAAANRAREGLRVVEDYLRFVLDDRFLTEQLKVLRHELTAAISRFSLGERLAARETQADVGTAITTPAEGHREDLAQVLAANFTRVQEALRSLEEFAKLLDPDASALLKQLRYRTYTLQRAVEITRASASRLASARLYVLLDGRASLDEFAALARSLVEAGVHVIQLRDKRLDDRQLLERAAALREITRAAGVLFIVNDRPDLAVLARADGVHVGQEDVSVKAARTIVGPDALVGVSTHWIEQSRQAVLDGANYIGVGPTFPSETKQFDQFPGLELLRAVAGEIRLPAFAIGGIGPENVAEVLQTGMGRIAVSGAVLGAADPAAAALALSRQLTGQPGPT
jgi:thiamine-phosphate pyrophosphorylase